MATLGDCTSGEEVVMLHLRRHAGRSLAFANLCQPPPPARVGILGILGTLTPPCQKRPRPGAQAPGRGEPHPLARAEYPQRGPKREFVPLATHLTDAGHAGAIVAAEQALVARVVVRALAPFVAAGTG